MKNNADGYLIRKENIIITGTVQKKLPYLIFLKDEDEAFCVCSSFQQQKDGSYSANARFIRYLCANSEELRDMTVNEMENRKEQNKRRAPDLRCSFEL